MSRSEPLQCAHCGVVIGVYEPLVRVVNGVAHETSRAATPDVLDSGGECYHAACYDPDVHKPLIADC